ncbi:MAG TPA: ComF family protein [Crinalium sp.]|jgi:ComF family protein
MKRWSSLLTPVLELFLESPCPLCDRSTPQVICRTCEQQVARCQLPNSHQFWQPPLPLFAWGEYGGALKRAIASLKYEHHPQMARPLGHRLAHAWIASPMATKRLAVVPIPMHPDKQKKRGFNQAELLASAFCEISGLPLQAQALRRSRSTNAQFGLSKTDREQNLAGAFQPGGGFSNIQKSTSVLLLDDIYTTGATARAAAQVFQAHNIQVYGMVAIAKPFYKE